MKNSSRIISLILATALTVSALSACDLSRKKEEENDGINRVTVFLPKPTEEEEIVNIAASVTMDSYLTARAYLDLILEYDTENMSEEEAAEFVKLIDDATVLFENTELLSNELIDAVYTWESSGAKRGEAEMEKLSASPSFSLSFGQNVYAADKSPAEEWAKEIVETYDSAKPGTGIKTLAEQIGTDAKHAYAQLKQAQAILEGQAYTDVSDKADQILTGLKTLKAAGSTASFVIAVSAAPTSPGLIETGGILCTGLCAIAQVGSLSSEIICGTENNYVSTTLNRLDDKASKIGTIFGLAGLGGAVSDISKTGKSILSGGWGSLSDSTKESFINNSIGVLSLASSELTNYLDDGSLIGGAVKVTDKGIEITLMDTKTGKKDEDTERAKQLLKEVGLEKSEIKAIMNEEDNSDPSDSLPEKVAEQIIENNAPLTPDGGFDVTGFISAVDGELGPKTEPDPSDISEEVPLFLGKWYPADDPDSSWWIDTTQFSALEEEGLTVEYSIDEETGGLKISCKGDYGDIQVDEYEIFIFVDANTVKYTRVDHGDVLVKDMLFVRGD